MASAKSDRMVIIGAGNIGSAIAAGVAASGLLKPAQVTLCNQTAAKLEPFRAQGFAVSADNVAPLAAPAVVIIAVKPHHADKVLAEIAPALKPGKHVLVSVMTGVTVAQMRKFTGDKLPVVRAMPNTAIAIRESMTCLATDLDAGSDALKQVRALFDAVGLTVVIGEDQMAPATALAGCGIAFFLRAIRSASQGGIEVGFSAQNALTIAVQTAKGAACLLQKQGRHPEAEIDRVTTPRGCTIAGLNQMEHEGFSSALIKGIVTASQKAADLRPEAKK